MKNTKHTQHLPSLAKPAHAGTDGEGSGAVEKSQIKNRDHLAFIRHYLQCRNQAEAYRRAYPGCSDDTARTNGSKLYKNPQIRAAIDRELATIEQEAMDKARAQIVADLAEQYVSIHEKRMLLTDIMRRRSKMNRYFKMKEEIQVIEDDLPPYMLLRAIDMDTKFENGYYDRKPLPLTPAEKQLQKEEEKKRKAEEERKKAERWKKLVLIFGNMVCSNNKYPHLTWLEERALWQLSLTHESIDAKPLALRDEFLDCGCTLERNMETGMYHMSCPDTPEAEKLTTEKNSVKLSQEDMQPLDDEQLAEIVKNSPLITAALNNELTIILRTGERVDENGYPENQPANAELIDSTKSPSLSREHTRGGEANKESASEGESDKLWFGQKSPARVPNLPDRGQNSTGGTPQASSNQLTIKSANPEEYRPVKEIWEEYMRAWQKDASQKNNKRYIEVKAMYFAKDESPQKRQLVELKSPWEFHPDNPQLMRKKTA